jgi:hypothetical protein
MKATILHIKNANAAVFGRATFNDRTFRFRFVGNDYRLFQQKVMPAKRDSYWIDSKNLDAKIAIRKAVGISIV